MVWITMSLAPHAGKKRKKSNSKPHLQINKCLNEKRRREQENVHIEELAELVSASPSDMSSLSCKPDKCAILKETVNQIRTQEDTKIVAGDELQESEVTSSKPNIINNNIFGSILLEALEGFLFVVDIDGKVEFVSENITAFLKYHQDEIYEKNIYDYIHPADRARFNQNLLLMMPMSNTSWTSETLNSAGKPVKHFNCQFLVRPEDPEIKMENKQTPINEYVNLSITANYMPVEDEGSNEVRNRMTCIARRAATEEKRATKIEHFTTKTDREGKIVDVETSAVALPLCQYLRKELIGSQYLDFCHPNDVTSVQQHLKNTLETGMATCGPTKFHIGGDRYVRVKMKSRSFQGLQGTAEFVVSSHAVIRDNENSSPVFDSPKSTPSPSLTSTSSGSCSSSSGSGSTSDSSSGVNGSLVLSPLAMSNSFGNYPTSNAGNTSEFQVSELVLDMFPNPTWPLDSNSSQTKDLDSINIVSSPQATPTSNHSSESSAAASPTNSAFVAGLSSNRNSSAATSPAVQNRASTPYSGSCYSPAASQSVSGKVSPTCALPAKADTLICSSTETSGINNISQGMRQDRYFDLKSNQKLRNLLTQNISDVVSRKNSGLQSQEEVTILSDTHSFDDSSPNQTHMNAREIPNVPRTVNNVILRDLLNQEDDDSDVPVEPIVRSSDNSVPSSFLNAVPCKVTEGSSQQRLGNNNMLRKLLNNDDVDRNYRKSQDLIHQLLIAGSGNKSFQNDHIKIENITSPQGSESYVPKLPSSESSRITPEISFISETGLKRRAAEKFPPSTSAKRPAHAHLAGQNPMLASMLAQTPKTPPSVPTSVASTIMTQLPQERLPKNLEKKLVHTPYTTISVSGLSTSTQSFSPILINSSIQKDIVTSDSRGHVMQPTLTVDQSGIKPNYPQQVYIDKILNNANDSAVIARSLGLSFSTINSAAQNSATFSHQLSQNSSTATTSVSLADILSEATLVDVGSLSDTVQTNQASDPVFAEILEQIYSLQEDHKVETPRGAEDHSAILKLLGEVIDAPQANITSRSIPVTSAQDINEKIAISAIQKELMEGSSLAVASRSTNLQNSAVIPTYSQAGRTGTQVSGTPMVQTLTTDQILLLQQQQQQLVNNALPPQYSIIANRVKLPSQTQLINSQELLAQAVQRRGLQLVRSTYLNIGNANVNQMKKVKQQRLYLQQQQKRLLEQQQKQQFPMQTQQNLDVINSPGTSSFPENMNDLLNNTVAPNVTLLPSTGLPEASSSARFNLTLANPLPSPTSQTPPSAQLSPVQRSNPRSPFSPLSQQPFPSQTPPPSSYQAAKLSPHPPPSYPQEGSSHSPSSLPTTGSPHLVLSPQSTTGSPQWTSQRTVTSPIQNLQLQNPMLNAQLSQQTSTSVTQVRLSSQPRQHQQFRLRSLPSPSSQGNRNIPFPSASDVSYSAVSPAMVLQSQTSQQQRAQRTASVSSRISTSQSPSNFISGESALSPQSLPSPNLIQSATSTATTFMSSASPGLPITYTVSPSNQQFTFDRQNIQVFASNSDRLTPIAQVSSDAVRQEMCAGVGPRQQNQQLSQPSSINQTLSSNSVAQVLNVSLTREALEELGLSMELLPGSDSQPPQALYSQGLLNVASTIESSLQPTSSPNVQVELEPSNQKKSLLQQLLSEPTT
ncbi:mucin-17-like [Uloborus diversus]|uniref:mucin-17-like n=1 Tax=Uloborus diversus TaxID=327109 RepID=UPI0024090393|nr:mucin-17-like [Uloborus diversus]